MISIHTSTYSHSTSLLTTRIIRTSIPPLSQKSWIRTRSHPGRPERLRIAYGDVEVPRRLDPVLERQVSLIAQPVDRERIRRHLVAVLVAVELVALEGAGGVDVSFMCFIFDWRACKVTHLMIISSFVIPPQANPFSDDIPGSGRKAFASQVFHVLWKSNFTYLSQSWASRSQKVLSPYQIRLAAASFTVVSISKYRQWEVGLLNR